MKPDIAAMPFEIPIRVPAYCGAMSMWFTKYPEKTQPLMETATVSRMTASTVCVQSRKLNPINSKLGPNDPKHMKQSDVNTLHC